MWIESKRTGAQCVTVTLNELLQIKPWAQQLTLFPQKAKSQRAGLHLSRLLGKGMEFAESRNYQAGDDVRAIDWRITARTGKTHTKLFHEEKERQVILAVDMRSAMFFATQGVFKSVQAALIASCIGWKAITCGNRLGAIIFNESQTFDFSPQLGKKSLLAFLKKLSHCQPICNSLPRSDNSPLKIENMLLKIEQMNRPGSLIFLISDFRNFSSQNEKKIQQLAKQSMVYLCFLHDPFEASLPSNFSFSITDNVEEVRVDPAQETGFKKYHELFLKRESQLKNLAKNQRIALFQLSTKDNFYTSLMHHFR